MRIKALFVSAILLSTSCLTCAAQTDIAANLYGAFNQSTTGNGVQQSPSNSAGVLLELRHISKPLVGYEVTYSYNRADQNYSLNPAPQLPACTSPQCTYIQNAEIPNNAHEITGDWIVSFPLTNLKPFVLAGGGLLLNQPSSGTLNETQCSTAPGICQAATSSASTSSSTKGVIVYGAGIDWTVLPHLGLRFQYRGNLYKAADLTNAFSSTHAFTHTAEPMVGAFLRF